jgi:hypothetical protein
VLVKFRKAGEAGEVAVNPEQVSYIRSAAGPFTDIYFGEHRVSVQGTFTEVLFRLTAGSAAAAKPPPEFHENWHLQQESLVRRQSQGGG